MKTTHSKSSLYDLEKKILSDRLGHIDKIFVVSFSADQLIYTDIEIFHPELPE
jgi:hypothetical protein